LFVSEMYSIEMQTAACVPLVLNCIV